MASEHALFDSLAPDKSSIAMSRSRPLPSQNGRIREIIGNAAVLVCACFVLLGAFYFGIASCGGYVLHKEAFRGVSVALYAAALVCPSSLLATIGRKVVYAIGVPLLFVLVESAAVPFYPGPPGSLAEYGAIFLRAIKFGPCS